jgi:preprotein translocase subunit SecG
MLFNFLLVLQTLIAAAMVGVILLQRSEGGGLGVGGSPSGLMSARGAADFLTRATSVLAFLFVALSIVLAGLATVERTPVPIDTSAAPPPASGAPLTPGLGAPPVQAPPAADPLAGAAQQAAGQPAANQAAPAPAPAPKQ